MTDYRNFSAEHFLTDPLFRAWVLGHDEQAARFWKEWLLENEDRTEMLTDARAILSALQEKPDQVSDQEVDGHVQATLAFIRGHKNEPGSASVRTNWIKVSIGMAAVICVAAGLSWTVLLSREKLSDSAWTANAFQQTQIVKRNSSQVAATIRLEDNSTVILQPNSELRYPAKFGKQNREVYLKGEAFFDITKNPEHPFIVFSNDLITKVLGTSFTVKAYEGDTRASVSVKTGRVSVFSRKDQSADEKLRSKQITGVILTPNQQVVYEKGDERLLKRIVEDPQIIAKVADRAFSFDEAPVKDVFGVLEKAYGIEIVYDEKTMANCLLTANLAELTLYQELDLICRIISARYEIMDSKVIIYGKGCNHIQ